MATESRMRAREHDLRPTHWPMLPRGGTLLRTALVAALLALAAGVLYARERLGSCAPLSGCQPLHRAPRRHRHRPERRHPKPGFRCPRVRSACRSGSPSPLAVVQPGVRVDLLAVPATAGGSSTRSPEPTVVAARALVLDVVGAGVSHGSTL